MVLVSASLAPRSALAQCQFVGESDGINVLCEGFFNFSLIEDVVEGDRTITLESTFDDDSDDFIFNDLEAGDTITLNGSGSDQVLILQPDAETFEPGVFNLRGGNDVANFGAAATVDGTLDGGPGNDSLTLTGQAVAFNSSFGALNGISFRGGQGDDVVNVGPNARIERVFGGAGADAFTISGAAGAFGSARVVEVIEADPAVAAASIRGVQSASDPFSDGSEPGLSGGSGPDGMIVLPGGFVAGRIEGNAGNDTIDIRSGGFVDGALSGDDGADTLLNAGLVTGSILGGDGNDDISVAPEGFVGGDLVGNAGNDTLESAGVVSHGILGGGGNDTLRVTGGFVGSSDSFSEDAVSEPFAATSSSGVVAGGGGDDLIALGLADVGGDVSGGSGNDTITVDGTLISGVLFGDAGNDVFDISGEAAVSAIEGGEGDDSLTLREGSIGAVATQSGNDRILLSGANVTGSAGIDGGTGDDAITVNGGVVLSVFGGTGDDMISFADGVVGTASGGGGNDIIGVSANARLTTVAGAGGDDRIVVSGGTIDLDVAGGAGSDTVHVMGGTIASSVSGDAGNDTVTIAGGLVGRIDGGAGDDTLEVAGGRVGGDVSGAGGSDTVILSNGIVTGALLGADGDDTLEVIGGTVDGIVSGGMGRDTVSLRAGNVGADLSGGEGDDTLAITGGTAAGTVFGDIGNDAITLAAGTVAGDLSGGAGDDTLAITGGNAAGTVSGGIGNDTITLGAGTLAGDLSGGDGDDTVEISGGVLVGSVFGEGGNDTVVVSGGTVEGSLSGGEGDDVATFTGGALAGAVMDFEAVNVIGAPGVVFAPLSIAGSGRGASVSIEDAEFAPASGSSLSLTNVASLTVSRSMMQLTGLQNVGSTSVTSGSTLRVFGDTTFAAPSGGFGALNVFDATVTLINGNVNDTLSVGDLILQDAIIGVDVDPVGQESDTINVAGLFDVTGSLGPPAANGNGNNVLLVNFVSDPTIAAQNLIPLFVLGVGDPSGTAALNEADFRVQATSPSLLANLELFQAPDGSVFLLAGDVVPDDVPDIAVTNPTPPVTQVVTRRTLDVVADVTEALADSATQLRSPDANVVQITPTFGVFANGTAGRIFHDGFDVTAPGITGVTPQFVSDNLSVIGTGELDVSKEFGLEDIGIRASAFGGYVRSDVDISRTVDGFGTTAFRGSGLNEGGVFGASALASKIVGLGNLNYGLLAVGGFLGQTNVVVANTGATGSYATRGIVASGKAGRNIAVSDTVRLDVRFGASFAAFEGDAFTDSTGVRFGRTTTSFGLVSFEPGISTAVPVGDAVLSPFGRLLVQGRLGYENTARFSDTTFNFDDGDLTIGAQLGANVRLNERLSAGASIEGRASEDQESVLAKLAVKYTLPN